MTAIKLLTLWRFFGTYSILWFLTASVWLKYNEIVHNDTNVASVSPMVVTYTAVVLAGVIEWKINRDLKKKDE